MRSIRAADIVAVLKTRGGDANTIDWVQHTLDGVALNLLPLELQNVPRLTQPEDREAIVAALLDQILEEPLDERTVAAMEQAAEAMGVKAAWYRKRIRAETGLTYDQLEALAVFGLSRDFSADDLKKSHRKLMKTYHPDRAAQRGEDFAALAARKTVLINAAKEALDHLDDPPAYNPVTKKLEPDYVERDRAAREQADAEDERLAQEHMAKMEAELRAKAEAEGVDYDALVAEIDAEAGRAPPPGADAEADEPERKTWDEADGESFVSEWKEGETFDLTIDIGEEKPRSRTVPLAIVAGVWAGLTMVTICGVGGYLMMDPDFSLIKDQASTAADLAASGLARSGVVDEPLPEAFLVSDPAARIAAVEGLGTSPEDTVLLRRVHAEDRDPSVRSAARALATARFRKGEGDLATLELLLADAAGGPDAQAREAALELLMKDARSLGPAGVLLRHPSADVRLQGLELAKATHERLKLEREYEDLLSRSIAREGNNEVKVTLEAALIELHQHQRDYEGIKVQRGIKRKAPVTEE